MAVRLHPPLKTRGGAIVDARGRVVRLLGVTFTQLAPGRGQSSRQTGSGCTGWTPIPHAAYDNIEKWGFNFVRLAISWANLEPYRSVRLSPIELHHWNERYLRAVDAAVRQFTSRGIGVMLEMSQDFWSPAFDRYPGSPCPGRGMPAWLYEGTRMNTVVKAKIAFFRNHQHVQEGLATAWRVLAGRYVHNPLVIGADMLNEPYLGLHRMSREDMRLGLVYEKLGSAIRQANPNMLLTFQDSQDVGEGNPLALKGPPPFANVVYQFHLYKHKWKPDGIDRMQRFERRARKWGVPLFMGEFNAFKYGRQKKGPAPNWKRDTNELMAYCKNGGISWAFFAYSGGNSMVIPGTHTPKPGLLPVLQGGF
jgi:endoglycosylceramidase